jgi:disulfide bond formation protein DsbB
MNSSQKDSAWILLFLCWIVALVSTLGSLFFSEVMKYPPCLLCWYQRIFIYPLVIIFLAGLFPLSREVFKFSLPILLIGWPIALYHNLLYYKILPESAAPCVQGISCTSVHIEWAGFITIPFLSLMAYSILIVLLLKFRKLTHE